MSFCFFSGACLEHGMFMSMKKGVVIRCGVAFRSRRSQLFFSFFFFFTFVLLFF